MDGHTLSGCSYRFETGAYEECTDSGGSFFMAWNQVEGDGSVILADGVVDIYDRALEPLETLCGPWKSTDGGHTWRQISVQGVDPCENRVLSLTIAPDGRALMVLVKFDYDLFDYQYSSATTYKSTDAGETWEPFLAPDGNLVLGVMYLGNHYEE